jgi:hypothetical protein
MGAVLSRNARNQRGRSCQDVDSLLMPDSSSSKYMQHKVCAAKSFRPRAPDGRQEPALTPILPSEASRTSLLRPDPVLPGNVGHDDTVNSLSGTAPLANSGAVPRR